MAPSLTIGGWLKTTLVDYPGQVAASIFLQGCNYRCPFCHNPALVPGRGVDSPVAPETVLDYLSRRRGVLDGVCLSGGEPLVQPLEALLPFLRRLRQLGLRIKLDTNGALPDRLSAILEGRLVDYVALDLKAPPALYEQAIGGVKNGPESVQESVSLLRDSGVAHELRTTVAPGLIGPDEVALIGAWLGGESPYILQQFRPRVTLDREWIGRPPLEPSILHHMANLARQHFPAVEIRGI